MTRRLKSVSNKYFCNNCYDRNYLIECKCGCGGILSRYDKYYMKRDFIKGHANRLKDFSKYRKGMYCHSYRFGRYKHSHGYWILTNMYGYTNADKKGTIREHIYNFQEYYQCSLLPWGVVHHIIPITKDYCNNMIWNLMGMTRSQHMKLHKAIKKKTKL